MRQLEWTATSILLPMGELDLQTSIAFISWPPAVLPILWNLRSKLNAAVGRQHIMERKGFSMRPNIVN